MYENRFRYTSCLASDTKDLREHKQGSTLLQASLLESPSIVTHVVERRPITWLEETSEVVVKAAKI